VALAATLLAASAAAALPAAATDGPPVGEATAENETREPPDLPERWQETYGGSGDDIFADAVRTDDGGYLLVGWTGGDDRDGWVLKTDADGERQWAKRLGGSGADRLWSLARTEDGYLLAGRTTTDGGPQGWLVEISSDGELRENRTVGEGAFYALERRDSGGDTAYLAAGWTRGESGRDGWTVALDADRSTAWQESYAAPEGYNDGYLRAVVPTDAGYYLAGKIEGDNDDGWALRIGPDGERAWQATPGGPSRDDVWAAASAAPGAANATASSADAPNASAGFVLVGETESDSTGPRDGWLVKFGPEGTVEWERKPGGDGLQWLDSAMRTEDGYLFTGGSDAGPSGSVDGYVLATDAEGETRREEYHGTDGWDKPWPAIRAHDGGYLLAGQTSGGDAAGKDGWLLRIGGSVDGSDSSTATGGASGTAETTDEAIQGDAATATADPESGVPGFGVGAALVALLAAALLAAFRR
jgi:PGF-CTERM protein